MDFLKELFAYFRMRKKYWLIPILIVCLLFGGLVIFGKGSVIAPFIYAVF